jgi:hypothetical protein
MSEINIVFISSLLNLDGESLYHVDWKLGDMVRSLYSSSTGTIVEKICDKSVRVLWNDFYNPFLDTLGRPGGMINYNQVARNLFTVEPLPQGAILFYLNEMVKVEGEEP